MHLTTDQTNNILHHPTAPRTMSEAAPVDNGKKRKRTGKQREEKKRAAIEVGGV